MKRILEDLRETAEMGEVVNGYFYSRSSDGFYCVYRNVGPGRYSLVYNEATA